jgi:hypothetical protein
VVPFLSQKILIRVFLGWLCGEPLQRRRARPGAWRRHAVKLPAETQQVLLSVSGVSDKLVTSSRLAVAMSAAGLHTVATIVS